MKSIMISIKPQYVAKILNGEKTIEVRKRFPLDYRGWVYIYCTKSDEKLFYSQREKQYKTNIFSKSFMCLNKDNHNILNGKVVARFYCDDVEEMFTDENGMSYYTDTIINDYEVSKLACLDDSDIDNYLQGKIGYAIHISQLEIFDKPKELWECKFKVITEHKKPKNIGNNMWVKKTTKIVLKAPMSWQYVEVEE